MIEELQEFTPEKMQYLRLLAQQFPSEQAVCTEIINLTAIQNLPKGTEHFMSDIHGESEAFEHIMNNCSGVIREKVLLALGKELSKDEINAICTLIYYPAERLEFLEKDGKLSYEWYKTTLTQLIRVARTGSSKYTRSKVRKQLKNEYAYIIDELLHVVPDEDDNQIVYHEKILDTIIRIKNGDAFIIALSELIKSLAIDRFHLVGDIFDRGPRADYVMDRILKMKRVDIQWGNHDVLWLGAAAGSPVCIANVIRNNIRYDNLRILESGYGVSLRELTSFASKHYEGDPWEAAIKAINILTLKLEGIAIKKHPEWKMEERLLFEKTDFKKASVMIDGQEVGLNTDEFPTVDPADPYKLTDEETEVMNGLVYSFRHSLRLKEHMKFLLKNGSIYLIYNNNLLFHGCVPLDENGEFYELDFGGRKYRGRALLNACEKQIRQAYDKDRKDTDLDLIWYLWGGQHSPVCGRILKTWERTLIDDKEYWAEPEDPYYAFCRQEETCDRIFKEFRIDPHKAHIINGHTPVRAAKGENPVKANGKLIVIDGGFCKAYHSKTGIAGYTMVYSSHGMALKVHQPFADIKKAITENADIASATDFFEPVTTRVMVQESDEGTKISGQISDLKQLLQMYRYGAIRERD